MFSSNNEVQKVQKIMEQFEVKKIEDIDISKMNLETLLSFFDLKDKIISIDHIKYARSITNKMHPDKCQLSPIYFILYRNVFDILLQLYEDERRFNIIPDLENSKYNEEKEEDNKVQNQIIRDEISKIQKLDTPDNKQFNEKFNEKFNDFYNENYMKVIKPEINNWFYQDSEVKDHFQSNHLVDILLVKENQNKRRKENTDIIMYETIQTRNQDSHQESQLFDNDSTMTSYISSSSATHGNLMFDDIRRVHRDETVFTVDNSLYNEKAISVEQFERMRNEDTIPLDNTASNDILNTIEKHRREIHNERLVHSINKTKNNEKISKSFLSRFFNIM